MLGERLRTIRKSNNLTQKYVAEILQMPRSTYNSYEQGVADPNVDTLIKLAKILNVSVDTLVGNETTYSKEKRELLEIINKLSDIECRKLYNYAEGIIMNRQVETRKNILKLHLEEEN